MFERGEKKLAKLAEDYKSEPAGDIDKEELKSAKEVVQFLTKTAKTLKIYLPNNPIHQKFLQDLAVHFTDHLQEYGTLKLKVKQYELLYGNEAVYENPNRLESLAFCLFVDGLREISFHPGLGLDEVMDFLEVVGKISDTRGTDDDVVTLLWEKRFSHITYLIVEDFWEYGDPTAQQSTGSTNFQAALKEESKTVSSTKAPSSVLELLGPMQENRSFVEIFQLSDKEVEQIKQQIHFEASQSAVSLLIDILSAILRVEKEYDAFSEIVGLLENALDTVLSRGEMSYAIMILELYQEMLGSEAELTEPLKNRINKAIEHAGDGQRIKHLETLIAEGKTLDGEQLNRFLLLLDKNALLPLSDLLGKVDQMKLRRVVCDALAKLGKEHIGVLLGRLEDRRWYVVRNIVYVLGKIGDVRAIDKFRKLVRHDEVKVRKEVIRALEEIKHPKATELLPQFIQDEDLSIRTSVVRLLARANYKEALEAILQVIQQRDFEEKDLYEKREFMEALAHIGKEEVLPILEKVIKRKGFFWFKREKQDEMAICAAMALKIIGTRKAIGLLEEGSRSTSKAVRDACAKAIEELKQRGTF
jgi:HEAT repeat protein